MNYQKEYERWLASGALTEEEKAELCALEDGDEREMAFGRTLTFGTAGLRATMTLGPGRMNRHTVAQATQGMADLVISTGGEEAGVAVAYDSRHNSRLFAETAASVLAANGVKVYLFDGVRPTPELSFAVRHLGCRAGINITASHNPKAYNGYKAYWEDGAQLAPEQAEVVSRAIAEVDVLGGAKITESFDEALKSGLVTMLGRETDEAYLAAIEATAIDKDVIGRVADDLKIVYTPLHGVGGKLVPEILTRAGLKNICLVKEQIEPDGDFPTVTKPNPEYAEVFQIGIELAEEVGSDLIIATDPDADRLGVMSRRKDGSFATITGNQMGALLLDYVITARREKGLLPEGAFAIKTIVSTDMVDEICRVNGIVLHDVLTGFKFIGEVIKEYEERGEEGKYIFGFEESYGYLLGSYARDKDAVGMALLVTEMTAYYKEKGMTLSGALEDLYRRYGYYKEETREIYMEGLDGNERRSRIMSILRENPPKTLGGKRILSIADYQKRVKTDTETGATTPLTQPESNVLSYTVQGGDTVVIRPSGTEPKIKIYYLLHDETPEAAERKFEAYYADASRFATLA